MNILRDGRVWENFHALKKKGIIVNYQKLNLSYLVCEDILEIIISENIKMTIKKNKIHSISGLKVIRTNIIRIQQLQMHVYELYNISYFPTSQGLKQKCIVYINASHFNINVELRYLCGNITSLSC